MRVHLLAGMQRGVDARVVARSRRATIAAQQLAFVWPLRAVARSTTRSGMTDGIVLVHGAMHTSACWSRLLPLLELPAVAVDLPGRYGRPGDLATIGLDDCVAAVIQDADHASLGTFALVGHSLGGVTVTETAYRHPHRVSHLVYVGAVVLPLGSTAARLMTGGDWEGEMEPGNDE